MYNLFAIVYFFWSAPTTNVLMEVRPTAHFSYKIIVDAYKYSLSIKDDE